MNRSCEEVLSEYSDAPSMIELACSQISSSPSALQWAVAVGLVLFIVVAFFLWFGPVYGVWASRKRGEAELAEANFAEQVAIAEANARLKAAETHKKAEVIDAEAVALSMEKIGKALEGNEPYLRWQWIRMMQGRSGDTIYVPTEASLPILEAGQR